MHRLVSLCSIVANYRQLIWSAIYFQLIVCICVTTALADDVHGGGGFGGGLSFGGFGSSLGSVRSPAFMLPIPEIGFTFDKLPLFIPIPKIVLGHRPTIVSKPIVLPSSGFGGSFGLGLGSGFGHGVVKHIHISEGFHGDHW